MTFLAAGRAAQLEEDKRILSWELDDVMSSNRAAQFEAFLRWSLAGGTEAGAYARIPSLILVNRGGPHTLSRRGRRVVVVS